MAHSILTLLWTISWQTAILATVVFGLSRVARKAPASWRCALWLIVIIKLFLPPFAHVPAGLDFRQRIGSVAGQPGPVGYVAPTMASPAVVHSVPEPPSSRGDVASSAVNAPRVDASRALSFLWLAGVLAMAAMLAVRYSRQGKLVRGSPPAGDDLIIMLHECAEQLGLGWLPGLRLSDLATTPMLVGAMRPVILLPTGLSDSCGETDVRAMLLHELAHVRRCDMAVLWLQQLAQTLFFFHPAVWLAGREMRRERELACDELVLSRAAIAPKDYAAGYVSALKLANARPAPATSLAMAEPFDLEKRRLHGILDGVAPKLSMAWVAALIAILVIGLPTFAGFAAPPRSREKDARVLAGLTPIEGPGLVIVLRDSPKRPKVVKPASAIDYVVHDRDIRNTVNELWAAGAKAISVNGQRLVTGSFIRCVGPVILVNSIRIVPPFVISAVGKAEVMNAALTAPNGPADGLKLLGMISIRPQRRVIVHAYRPPFGSEKQSAEVMAGLTPVHGAGVVVTLQDSPRRSPKEKRAYVVANYMVQDRDVLEVANELWSAGAKAISVNGQRLVTNSSIRGTSGGKVWVNSVPITKPFVINAIGKPDALRNALMLPYGIADGLMLLDMIQIRKEPRVEVPSYGRSVELR
jgi:uncharacterized protein YlxW (UPF0749 family)/beta-lactamase regulating signal transducer with metallopeptidase domain